MIRYALACQKGHPFESWFENSAAYDKQAKRGLVSCPICGPFFRTRTDRIVRMVSSSFFPRFAAKAAKSCWPMNFFATSFRRSTSSGAKMCQARPSSSGGKTGAAQIR